MSDQLMTVAADRVVKIFYVLKDAAEGTVLDATSDQPLAPPRPRQHRAGA